MDDRDIVIYVRVEQGIIHQIVSLCEKVGVWKQRLLTQDQVHISKLMYSGLYLHDDKTFADYDISDSSTLLASSCFVPETFVNAQTFAVEHPLILAATFCLGFRIELKDRFSQKKHIVSGNPWQIKVTDLYCFIHSRERLYPKQQFRLYYRKSLLPEFNEVRCKTSSLYGTGIEKLRKPNHHTLYDYHVANYDTIEWCSLEEETINQHLF